MVSEEDSLSMTVIINNEIYSEGRTIKCVTVGDKGAGTTALLLTYSTGTYPQPVPTVFDNCAVKVKIDGEHYTVGLIDTTGQVEYDELRPLSYPQTDVFMVCFSVVSPHSLNKIQSLLIPEMKDWCPDVPFILVGTEKHLRHDPDVISKLAKQNLEPVKPETGRQIARKLRAEKYVECSAWTQEGLKGVFDEAIKAALKPTPSVFERAFNNGMRDGYVYLITKKLILMGPPGVGKTAFKSLLFNWPPPKRHHSTSICSRPIRAIERVTDANEGKLWDIVESPHVINMISHAIKSLDNEDSITIQELSCTLSDDMPLEDDASTIPRKISDPISIDLCELTTSSKFRPVLSTTVDYSQTIMKLLEKKKKIKKSKQLHKATWIHVLDSGGQPQFADISRAFLRGSAINVIVFKLTEKLSDKPRFTYSLNGKVINAPSELRMTNLQLIEHIIRSVTTSETTTVRVDGRKVKTKPFFIIIGTYYDEATKGIIRKQETTEETLAKKNDVLLSTLHEYRDHFIFYKNSSNELIFPVNNLCRLHRKKVSAKIRERIMAQENVGLREPVPIRWYMFELQMRELASLSKHGIITLKSCFEIGDRLHMCIEDVKACLMYFNSLTLCLYYDKLLPDVIFTNPQYLLDMLSSIVCVSFVTSLEDILPKGRSLSYSDQRLLHDNGVFDESLLDSLELPFVNFHFTKTDFLRLLQCICVIAPIESPELVQRYFMPAVLSTDALTQEQKAIFRTSIEPLVITFKSKVVLQGLFPTLIVSLLSRKQKPYFFIDSHSDNFPRQLRHVVKIYSEDLFGSVFLCDECTSIEVYFTGHSKYCYLLRQVILQALSTSATTLAYDISTLDLSALVACSRHHISSINDTRPHPITISYNNNPPLIGCSIEDLPVGELTNESQSCWLIESIDNSFSTEPSTVNVLPEGQLNIEHAPVILSAIKEVNLWEVFGIYLGVRLAVIDQIRRNNHYQIEPSRKDMIMRWLHDGTTATSQHLLSALDALGNRNIVYELSSGTQYNSTFVYSTLPYGSLNEDHVPLLLIIIKELNDWAELGIYLGLKYNDIEQIKRDNFYDIQTSRMYMIVKWIQEGAATCEGLISALKDMGKNNIVAIINSM